MNFLDTCPIDQRPNFAAIQEMWQRIEIAQIPLHSPRVQAVVDAFNRTYDNGGAQFTRFTIAYHPTLHWFVIRNRLNDLRFFDRFFRLPIVRASLPEFAVAEGYSLTTAFKPGSLFMLDGEVAYTLFQGGAYSSFVGTAPEAKQLGYTFVESLFANRYPEVIVYRSDVAWAAWFHDVAWDTTWVMIDQRYLTIDILCITDTD